MYGVQVHNELYKIIHLDYLDNYILVTFLAVVALLKFPNHLFKANLR